MNKKMIFASLALLTTVISACAPAATAMPTLAPREPYYMEEPAAEAEAPQLINPPAAAENRPIPTMAPLLQQPSAGMAYPTPAPTTIIDNGNEFQDYGINGYENSTNDHLSTFALDVDTASYSMTRQYLEQGQMPPAESVRVEEFVNSFDPGYAAPEDQAFSLYADGAPSPFMNDGTYLLRFGVQGYKVPDYARKPASLTFVIDVSGSMGMDNRLGLVKQSLNILVDRLNSSDSVAIVVYGTQAHMVLDPTNGDQKQVIKRAINRLETEGSTNAEAGLRLGYKVAMQNYRSGGINRVILCSDGVANTGATESEEILNYVHGYVEEGITLTSMGFGMGNYNDVLMEQLADNGDGNYAYIDDLDEARELFVDDLTSTLQVIARDAKIQIDFNPEVVSYYRLVGYENREIADQDFRDNGVDAGEIGAGHSAVALYAVHFVPDADGRIATMQLRWQDPDTYEVQEINGNINTWDIGEDYEAMSTSYRVAVTVMQFAEVLRQSPWGEETSLKQVRKYAENLRWNTDDPDVVEFIDLVERAAQQEWGW